MKFLSLAFLAVGVFGSITAFKQSHKNREADLVVVQAAQIVAEIKRDTVWVDSVVYRTKVVYIAPKRVVPDALFKDTSVISRPPDRLGVTEYRDTISNIVLEEFIKPPKEFVFQNDNVYLAGTILATGVNIDSLRVPAKLSLKHTQRPGLVRAIDISIISANPYVDVMIPIKFTNRALK